MQLFLATALLLLLAASVSLSTAQSKCETGSPEENSLCGAGGLQLFVGRKGGVIRVFRVGGDKMKKTAEIKVFVESIAEVDSSGKQVPGKHSIQQFNQVEFTVVESKNVPLANSGQPTVLADCLSCTGTLPTDVANGNASLTVCIVNNDGNLTMDDETTRLHAGQLKFSFGLTGWSWSIGAVYLDVDVNFKIPPGRSVNRTSTAGDRRKPVRFSLGEDATADFSSKVFTDNSTWKTMPADYPTFAQKGANNIITLRLPKFTNSTVYDPTINPGSVGDADAALHACLPAVSLILVALATCILSAGLSHASLL